MISTIYCFYFMYEIKSKMTTTEQLEQNKKNVIAFYDLMFDQNNPKEAINGYARDVYIQHNFAVGVSKEEAFIVYFERMAKEYPDKRVYFKRTIAEENYVVFALLSRAAWLWQQ